MDTKKLDKKWWKKEVGYQIYPRSFYDSNNDGIGDLNGITEKLDYLKDLGITLIWVCPIFKSPMDDNGYDISDYYDVNPEFGTKEDLEKLIAEAENFGVVAGEPETVFSGDFIGPLFHRPAVDLYGATALGAHQVMVVVAIAAMPVEAFAVGHM